MKAIIDGKRYDTETAEALCDHDSIGTGRGDFRHFQSILYRTKAGRFFLAGSGGPMTRWAESCGQNSWTGGRGIKPVDQELAREIMEGAGVYNAIAGVYNAIERLFQVEDA